MLNDVLTVIDSLVENGFISDYAIGGAVAMLFYTEPTVTYDLDIFCSFPRHGLLIDLSPLYGHLSSKGYKSEHEHVLIEGVPVQFLPADDGLLADALENAELKLFEGRPIKVFSYEHLLAIMLQVGRGKDRARLMQCVEAQSPDEQKLNGILSKFGLLEKWSRIVS